ncbi:MAG TPA: hypothetical protein VH186_33605 [Chloroflexia bacterium]|nr:hypothetical protein [Chloroflexia bacterium]
MLKKEERLEEQAKEKTADTKRPDFLKILRSPALWAFLGALLLAAIYGRVALFNLGKGVVGGDLDGYENLWNDYWVRTALFDLHRNPFYTNYLYYPIGISLRFHTLNPLNGIFALPLWPLIGSVATTNLKFLLSMALTVFCAYLFFKDQTGHSLASFTGAALFTFANNQLIGFYSFGQAEKLSQWWFPLYLFFLFRALRFQGKAAFWNGFGAFLCLMAMCLTDWQYILHAVLLTFGYALFCLLTRQSWREKAFIVLKMALVGGAWAAIVFVPLLLPMLKEARDNPWLSVSEQSDNRAKALNEYFEFGLGNPGYLALILLVIGLVLLWRHKPSTLERRTILFWAITALVAASLTLGPRLKWFPKSDDDTTGIPMPYALLYKLPVLNIGRDPGRFYLIFLTGFGLLLAFGLREIFNQLAVIMANRAKTGIRINSQTALKLISGILAGIIIAVSLGGFVLEAGNAKADPPDWPPFYYQLAQDKEDYAIMELPLFTEKGRGEDTYEAYQSIHGKPRFGGRLARDHKLTNPNNFVKRATLFRDFFWLQNYKMIELFRPSQGGDFLATPDYNKIALPLLNYYKVRYIILYPQALEATGGQDAAAERMITRVLGQNAKPVYQDDKLIAYRVPDAPPLADPLFIDTGSNGWYAAEKTSDVIHRWANPCSSEEVEKSRHFEQCNNVPSELEVFNLSQDRHRAHIEFNVFNYTQPRTVQIAFDGYPAAQKALAPGEIWKVALDLDVPPSTTTPSMLTLSSPEKPVPLDNPLDLRLLSFGVSQVQLQSAGK